VRVVTEPQPSTEDVEEWADRLAATFPPLTPDAVAEVGHLAAALDAERHNGKRAAV
jgi:hypothetical protein